MFEKLSKKLGADIDKIVFDNDLTERKKLERNLNKETMKIRTKAIQENN